jgi:hypothetical protein
MRIAPFTALLAALILAPALCAGQKPVPTRAPGWCTDSTRMGDSTFVVDQAIKALSDSVTKRLGFVYKVDSYQAIETGPLLQGVIVSLVAIRPSMLGGGGLVWIDAETYCPIVLRRYE